MRLRIIVFLLSLYAAPAAGQGTSQGVGQGIAQPDITTRELLAIINERDHRYTQRWESQERAIAKAEAAAEKRFDSVNEFRGQLKDQAATFAPRAEIEIRLKALDLEIANLKNSRLQEQGRTEGVTWLWGVLFALAGVLGTLMIGVATVGAFVMRQKAKNLAG